MSVKLITSIEEIQSISHQWQGDGLSSAFVPTMGNLHAGHLKLVETAKQHADRVVVSIFVNPLQFGPKEDFTKYPRTLDADRAKLESLSIDVVYAPDEKNFYNNTADKMTFVEVPGLSDILCGASRPGHFRGVTTVVNKLFNIVQPDVAVFGTKDFQQFTIIRQMVDDLSMPVKLIGVETMREADGLAMSSRNAYLSEQQRAVAPRLYETLQNMRQSIICGIKDVDSLLSETKKQLIKQGFQVDYLELRDAQTLQPPGGQTDELVILTAVYLGDTRLIDNIMV